MGTTTLAPSRQRCASMLLLLLPVAALKPAPHTRLCAIGDLHGDAAHAFDALRLCGAVDRTGRWSGGAMTVVQTGDVVDRGNASLPLLHALWELRDQAAADGGELLLLMGNHELLNMQGRTRYVHKTELFKFGGTSAWQQAMDPRHGAIGRQLAALPGAAVRGEGACRTLFLHAGCRYSTGAQFGTVHALNDALHKQVSDNDGALLDPRDGPLWWRGYARPHASGLSEDDACAEMHNAIASIGEGAVRMAVGHNIVPFVATRCAGALHMLDVGMSYAYEGRPAAWRCDLDERTGAADVRALYAEGEEEPPDLCSACDEVRRSGPHPVHGGDPHQDCANYCIDGPRRRKAEASGFLDTSLFGWGGSSHGGAEGTPAATTSGNSAKTEI